MKKHEAVQWKMGIIRFFYLQWEKEISNPTTQNMVTLEVEARSTQAASVMSKQISLLLLIYLL